MTTRHLNSSAQRTAMLCHHGQTKYRNFLSCIHHWLRNAFPHSPKVLQNIQHAKSIAPPPRPGLPLPLLPSNHNAAVGNLGSRCQTPAVQHPNPNAHSSGKAAQPSLPRPDTGVLQLLLVAESMRKRQQAWRAAFRYCFPLPPLSTNKRLISSSLSNSGHWMRVTLALCQIKCSWTC